MLNKIIFSLLKKSDEEIIVELDSDGSVRKSITGGELLRKAQYLGNKLKGLHGEKESDGVGLVAQNSIAWVVADIAGMMSRSTIIPISLFFSKKQARNLIKACDTVLFDEVGGEKLLFWGVGFEDITKISLGHLEESEFSFDEKYISDEDYVCKVIHTSGTTNFPKGVSVRYKGVSSVVNKLLKVLDSKIYSSYFSILPISLFLEQVLGVYMPIVSEGKIVFLSGHVSQIGCYEIDAVKILDLIKRLKPTSLLVVPSIIYAINFEAKKISSQNKNVPEELFGRVDVPFIFLAGGATGKNVLEELDEMGVKVYEGYGLSENSSLATLNTPERNKVGTVGKPLPGVQIKTHDDNELLIKSDSLFGGYTVEDPTACHVDQDGYLHTGDLAEIDADGYVTILGRKKNIIITEDGRNVCPEWIRDSYMTLEFVTKAVIYDTGKYGLGGFFVIKEKIDKSAAKKMIEEFGLKHLSELQRVKKIHVRHPDHSDEDVIKLLQKVTGDINWFMSS